MEILFASWTCIFPGDGHVYGDNHRDLDMGSFVKLDVCMDIIIANLQILKSKYRQTLLDSSRVWTFLPLFMVSVCSCVFNIFGKGSGR